MKFLMGFLAGWFAWDIWSEIRNIISEQNELDRMLFDSEAKRMTSNAD